MLCIAPDPVKHAEELFELIRICNGIPPATSRESYIGHSHYDWGASQIGIIDGKMVAHYGVWGYEMRIGSARLKTAGVGAVATHPDFRGKGLSSELIASCLAAMQVSGYAMTRLSGIPNFYHRFGYVRGWVENVYTAAVDDVAQAFLPVDESGCHNSEMPAPPKAKLAPCPPTALVELADAYNRQYRLATGTAVRPTFLVSAKVVEHHEVVRWGRGAYVVVKVDAEAKALRCCEYVGDATEALGVLGALAREKGCEKVLFESVPARSELIRILTRGNCDRRTAYIRSGGSMIRLISLAKTLEAMRGEFERLLRSSELAKWRGRLFLGWEREIATLVIRGGRVSVEEGGVSKHALSGGHAMAQLLLGTDEPGVTVESGGLRLRGDAKRLVPVLFPARDPVLSFADRF